MTITHETQLSNDTIPHIHLSKKRCVSSENVGSNIDACLPGNLSIIDRLNSSKIPEKVKNTIYRLKLENVNDDDERSKQFISIMYNYRVRARTAMKYYELLRRQRFFGLSTIKPNPRIFDAQIPPQQRVPTYKNVLILINWCKKHRNKYPRVYVILFGYYSGLRAAELCRFTNENLIQLKERRSFVKVKRKCNDIWSVTYHKPLIKFIDELCRVFEIKINRFYSGVIEKLFDISPNVLSATVRNYYINANNDLPPAGFGIHVMRYIIGTKLAENNKLPAAQRFLGHKQLDTTKHYLRYDLQELNKRLSKIVQTSYFYFRLTNSLESISEDRKI